MNSSRTPALTLQERLECGGNLSLRETAALADVSMATIYKHIAMGRLRRIKIPGRSVIT
jgi:hypothetical protein